MHIVEVWGFCPPARNLGSRWAAGYAGSDVDGDADTDGNGYGSGGVGGNGDSDSDSDYVVGNGRALVLSELLRSASNFKLKSVVPAWPQLKPSENATLQARVTQQEIAGQCGVKSHSSRETGERRRNYN